MVAGPIRSTGGFPRLAADCNPAHDSIVNQNSDNEQVTVSYQGEKYAATFSTSPGAVNVEIFWGNFHWEKTRQFGMGSPENIARLVALEILIDAKGRGELN